MKASKIRLLLAKLICLGLTTIPTPTAAQVSGNPSTVEYPRRYQDPASWQFEALQHAPLGESKLISQQAIKNANQNSAPTLSAAHLAIAGSTQLNADKTTGPSAEEIMKFLINTAAIVPNGAMSDPVPEECRGQFIENKIQNAGGQISLVAEELRKYFLKCEKVLSRNNDSSLFSLLHVELIKYELNQLDNNFAFRLLTPNGFILLGQILRKDNARRPWVIIKCGVFCEAPNDTRTKNIIMHLFDESPFNLMLLTNDMSATNIIANNRVNVNGYLEGQELIHAAYWLKYISPFHAQVAAVHGMGISLGGSASLFAALYNDHNLVQDEKLFKSMVAYCPVVNTYPTYKNIFRNNLLGHVFSEKTWQTMQAVYDYNQDVRRLIGNKKPKTSDYPRILSSLGWNYFSQLPLSEILNPFRFDKPFNDISQMWEINNFSNLAAGLKTPTLVFVSRDDSIVNYDINANTLKKTFNHDPNTNLRVVDVAFGNHCSPSLVYGWQSIASILRGFYLSMSPASEVHREVVSTAFRSPPLNLKNSDVIADYQWQTSHKTNKIKLLFKIWGSSVGALSCTNGSASLIKRSPNNQNPFTSDRSCYSEKVITLPYSALQDLHLHRPQTAAEAESQTRYLNSHIELFASGKPIYGKNKTPTEMKFNRFVFD